MSEAIVFHGSQIAGFYNHNIFLESNSRQKCLVWSTEIRMLRYHIIIVGDVQGVGFRYFTQKNASLYGITGWVRNKIDGTVEIEAEGSETNMTEFIKAVERGNRYSVVESTNIGKMTDMGNYKSFNIVDDE